MSSLNSLIDYFSNEKIHVNLNKAITDQINQSINRSHSIKEEEIIEWLTTYPDYINLTMTVKKTRCLKTNSLSSSSSESNQNQPLVVNRISYEQKRRIQFRILFHKLKNEVYTINHSKYYNRCINRLTILKDSIELINSLNNEHKIIYKELHSQINSMINLKLKIKNLMA